MPMPGSSSSSASGPASLLGSSAEAAVGSDAALKSEALRCIAIAAGCVGGCMLMPGGCRDASAESSGGEAAGAPPAPGSGRLRARSMLREAEAALEGAAMPGAATTTGAVSEDGEVSCCCVACCVGAGHTAAGKA